jgi:uncharacterized protein with PIN domain
MSRGEQPSDHGKSTLAQGSGGVKNAPLRFAADCMLGRLARWLRILGHDVVYFRKIEDADLVELARKERRILLTRDTRLVRRRAAREAILIESPYLEQQLRQLARWDEARLLAPGLCRRCLECNEPTLPVEKEGVRERVPPYVYKTQSRFRECPACRRIYWSASHVHDMLRRLRGSLGPVLAGGPKDLP